ncbi:hypothetical protein [Burkholderia gladioli]|uniref:hypothetical protein n=1 Tax=Burkholderia gladioli TaxID=28095 RepID=UPI001640DC7C|nr:hypothetical protein [Burkholderia gladioli]
MERVKTEHKPVEGVLFEAKGPWGTWTTLGIPFEHAGRLWAIHQEIGSKSLWSRWNVSDVETGRKLPRVAEPHPDAARAAAIVEVDAAGPAKIKAAVRASGASGKGNSASCAITNSKAAS